MACRTRIGRSHRKNQDSGGAWTWTVQGGVHLSLVLVADGVSSGTTSERASRLAVDAIRASVEDELPDSSSDVSALLDRVARAAESASHQIAENTSGPPDHADATTLAAVLCVDREAAGVWCGDSRVYLLRAGTATRLTRDHSWAEGAVSHGLMTVEQAARDPRAHMITRWLGPQSGNLPDLDTFQLQLKDRDTLLACTDGLYMYFESGGETDGELATLLSAEDVGEGLDRLIERALERGGYDDITGAAIRLRSE